MPIEIIIIWSYAAQRSSLKSLLGANPNIKILKGYLENESQALGLRNVECGFVWFSTTTEQSIYKIPYYVAFETVVNGNIKFSRSTAGGDVTITATSGWFTYMAFITKGDRV